MNTPVIDFHSHLARWERYGVDDEPSRYLRIMDAAGIDRSLVNCIYYGDARRNNDITVDFVANNPDRFLAVAFVTPHYPNEAISELERCFDDLSMKFLKIYPDYFGKPNDDPAYFPIYEFLNDRGLAVMAHPAYPFDDPDVILTKRYTALAERFPRVRWVLAHAAGTGLSCCTPPGDIDDDINVLVLFDGREDFQDSFSILLDTEKIIQRPLVYLDHPCPGTNPYAGHG